MYKQGIMRIIHVVDSLDPSQGGPPVVVTRLAAAQARLGNEVKIVAYGSGSDGHLAHADATLASRQQGRDMPAVTLLPCGLVERMTASAAYRYFRETIRPGDVVQLHGLWRPILSAAARAARHQHVKYVLMPHGMLAPWSLMQKRLKKRLALAMLWRDILSNAAMLHVLNEEEAAQARALVCHTPAEIIPNGIFQDEIENRPAPLSFYRAFPRLRNRPYILFLGRLHYKKGLDYLADAFVRVAKKTSQVDLVIAGPDEGAQASFSQQIASFGIADRVHIVGPLYGPQKYAAMGDALCFCLPSRQEGFSMAVIEAMACGLPVVISKQCNFSEVAQAGAGEVVVLDPQAISDALLRFISDAEYRRRAGAVGRELVLARYTWPKIAESSIEAYRRIQGEG
jgi:glycosyltransferase involved in cell wall biosynthesis